jgi:protease I
MTDTELNGRNVLAIVTNYGVEQDELVVPVDHLREKGAHVDIAAVTDNNIQTLVNDKEPGRTVQPTTRLDEVDAASYDLVLVPGGALNADALRQSRDAIEIVRAFTTSHRPVASICHGPWTLVEADSIDGKTLTSYPSLQTDLRNAGGTWVDQAVVSDDANGYTLVTSRNPGDLDDFLGAVDRVLTSG